MRLVELNEGNRPLPILSIAGWYCVREASANVLLSTRIPDTSNTSALAWLRLGLAIGIVEILCFYWWDRSPSDGKESRLRHTSRGSTRCQPVANIYTTPLAAGA
jgi:hypothetical protein